MAVRRSGVSDNGEITIDNTIRAGRKNQLIQGRLVTQTSFVIALAAEFTFGDYHAPTVVGAGKSEWIIVATCGAKGEFLTLSRTEIPVLDQATAPPGLHPRTTYLGILLSRVTECSIEESEYLLMRNRPADIPVGGVFHPSDGYVRLSRSSGDCQMTAHGRFAHSYGIYQGQPVVRDVPDPAPGSSVATAWHLNAVSRPWIGALLGGDGNHSASVRTSARTPEKAPPLPPGGPRPHTPRRKRAEELHGTVTHA